MSKPHVFKIAGVWVWMCSHPDRDAEPVISGRFTSAWRDPWTACCAEALRHHADQHTSADVEEG